MALAWYEARRTKGHLGGQISYPPKKGENTDFEAISAVFVRTPEHCFISF